MLGESRLLYLIYLPCDDLSSEEQNSKTSRSDDVPPNRPDVASDETERNKSTPSPSPDGESRETRAGSIAATRENSGVSPDVLPSSTPKRRERSASPFKRQSLRPSESPPGGSPRISPKASPERPSLKPSSSSSPLLRTSRSSDQRSSSPKKVEETLGEIFIPPTEEELKAAIETEDGKNEASPLPKRGSVLADNVFEEAEVNTVTKDLQNTQTSGLTSFVNKVTAVDELKQVLTSLGVKQSHWTTTQDDYHQVTFIDDGGQRCEEILERILDSRIGNDRRSSVSVMPISMHFELKPSSPEPLPDIPEAPETKSSGKGLTHFVKSVKSRLIVMQVIEGVRANARLTFDYVMLVILASCLAACGLIEDSSVILVASMLVSPLMGPILAGVFGHAITNSKLRNLGIKSEIVGLGICVGIGFILGVIFSLSGVENGLDSWPTHEMKSRGLLRSLWMGVLIAIPSGAAVALSILGGNVGSLVGVAISASLLPPMVNGGILLGVAIAEVNHCSVDGNCASLDASPSRNASKLEVNGTASGSLDCRYGTNHYDPVYRCSLPEEAALLGIVSIGLTILNILCIYIMAIIVFKIKEVAPKTALSPAAKTFWQKDVKTYRNYYKTVRPNTDEFDSIMAEWRQARGIVGDEAVEDEDEASQLADIVSQMKVHPHVQEIFNRAPKGPRVQTVFEDFNLKTLFSPATASPEDDEFVYENEDDDNNNSLNEGDVFLTITADSEGMPRVRRHRTVSSEDAVAGTITSNARVMLAPATIHASPIYERRVARIRFGEDGVPQQVRSPGIRHSHGLLRHRSHPRHRFQVSSSTPVGIFQLKTPNPETIKANRRAKKEKARDPPSASSTSSRFRVMTVTSQFRRSLSSRSRQRSESEPKGDDKNQQVSEPKESA